MSAKKNATLHIEWAPGRVFALDTATGRSASGETLSDVRSITSGHREALIGISRNAIFLKAVPLPKAAPEDLRRILGVQIGQLFPLPASQLAFDFYQTNERSGEGLLTLIAAVRADDLRLLMNELQRANLRPVRILPVSLGAGAIASLARTSDALVIESLPGGLALDIVRDGLVRFSRLAPVGSDPRQEASRTLAAFGSGTETLVTAGGLFFSDATERSETSLSVLDQAPSFGFELAEERARVLKQRGTVRMRLAALLMASALLLVGLVWADRSDAQAVVTRGQGTWTRELNKLRSIRDTELATAQKTGEIESAMNRAFGTPQPLSDVAKVVGDSLPQSSWLTGLILERGHPVLLRGTTTSPDDVAKLLKNLSATGRFRDVKLVFANSGRISETSVVQFSVTATAIGNLPLPDPPKPGIRRSANSATTSTGSTSSKEQKDSVPQ